MEIIFEKELLENGDITLTLKFPSFKFLRLSADGRYLPGFQTENISLNFFGVEWAGLSLSM